MRAVVIADTHGQHKKLKPLPEGDVLIHAGDMTNDTSISTALKGIRSLDYWFGEQDFKKVICISGNHDRVFAKGLITKLQNAIYLEDEHYEYEGVTFFGSPWTLPFYGVYNAHEGMLGNMYNKISTKTDVLITHGPPKGILDKTSHGSSIGSTALLNALNRIKPQYHVFGHVHFSTGEHNDNVTQFYNAAMAGKDFTFGVKEPWVFDIEGE
jgi:Icc-related predicted phosphoesterase